MRMWSNDRFALYTTSMEKLHIGILFGGRSAEHEVSLQSAKNVLEALDKHKFNPIVIFIDKFGKWFLQSNGAKQEALITHGGKIISAKTAEIISEIDVFFPVLHGTTGEDGSIQGLLEITGVPYVGSGVLGSAIGMDKDVMKRLLRDAGVPVTDFVVATNHDVNAAEIEGNIGLPMFVKPANAGSSIGVSKVDETGDLRSAIDEALKFDTKVLIEKAVVGSEIECAVLGNENPETSIIGRIIPRKGGFYSYEAKYLDEHGAVLEIPAKVPKEIAEKAREIALKTYRVMGCEGMARVDMFASADNEIIVNEINTIPGFTKISMYPKLWEASGISYTELITRLIELAIERHERRIQLITNFTKR